MNFNLYLQESSKAMANKDKKRGEDGNTNI